MTNTKILICLVVIGVILCCLARCNKNEQYSDVYSLQHKVTRLSIRDFYGMHIRIESYPGICCDGTLFEDRTATHTVVGAICDDGRIYHNLTNFEIVRVYSTEK